MRRRLITILVLALGLLLFTAQASLAQSPHFKKNGAVCTVSTSGASSSTTCSASLAGLGNRTS